MYNARQKRWETRTKIEWRWEDGHVQLNIDDLLITGSNPRQVNHRYLEPLSLTWANSSLYEPDYLAGWKAQAYQTTLTEAWESAKRIIREEAKQACHRNIPTNHAEFQHECRLRG